HRFAPNTAWCEWARANGCLPTQEEEVDTTEEVEVAMREGALADNGIAKDTEQASDWKACGLGKGASFLNFEQSTVDVLDELSTATSETVPSFAKVRHSITGEDDYESWIQYDRKCSSFDMASQRILVFDPRHYESQRTCSIFFFIEVMASQHHQRELGQLYNTLFTGNVLRQDQIHSDSRQTCSTCPWFGFYTNQCPSYYSYPSYTSSIELDKLFTSAEPIKNSLTSDFCTWSALDGQGTNDLFGGLFFEGHRHRGDFTCFLDADSEGDSISGVIGRLFDSTSSDNEDGSMGVEPQPDETEETTMDSQSEMSDVVADLESEAVSSPTYGDARYASTSSSQSGGSPPSSVTYSNSYKLYPPMSDCTNCNYEFDSVKQLINTDLFPQLRWMFRQTRWPIRFAPQQ
ncbi:unnamed protein product, partial [Hydatigera taeniaeformis]|uniref:Peptidase A1 domain-containing protein n=1 Tax=Hydatigena taeniaeformis TaxID=6205 RepID=A0A0R3WXI2_HYDTA